MRIKDLKQKIEGLDENLVIQGFIGKDGFNVGDKQIHIFKNDDFKIITSPSISEIEDKFTKTYLQISKELNIYKKLEMYKELMDYIKKVKVDNLMAPAYNRRLRRISNLYLKIDRTKNKIIRLEKEKINSINDFADLLVYIKEKFPELRYGQIISNAIALSDNPSLDIFYLRDNEIFNILKQYYIQSWEKKKK